MISVNQRSTNNLNVFLWLSYLSNPSARAGYDTRSVFKRSLTGLNSEFSFSQTCCLTKAEEHSLSYYLPIAGGRIIGFIPFPRVLELCEMQSVSSRIWTRIAVSISCDDNQYTTGTSIVFLHVFLSLSCFMCYNQTDDITTLDGTPLKLVDKFTYLGRSVSSTETDIDRRLTKTWKAINRLSIIWKSNLTDKMKRSFFQAVVVSILLYGCTTWTLTKQLEKKLDGNYTRMLRAILNKSWRHHPTKHQLYGHLPPITKTIQVRRTRHAGHSWRSRDELISDVLLSTPTYGRAKAGRPARTYIQQLCEDTGCSPEDLPEAMNDREKWRERVRDTCASGTTRGWWWHIQLYIYNYKRKHNQQ